MKKNILTLSFILLAGFQFQLSAQTQDYKFHSIFIYNFTKYIQWPASQQSGDFVIAVIGNSPIAAELEKITSNKVVGSQKIVVKRFKSVSEISDCHILYLPSSGSGNFDEIQGKLRGKSTLVITEKTGMAQKGSGINFVMQDNKWKFELNESATQSAGLKVSKELAQMAISA
ncbi:YfiR family protein [Rhodocytophaga rosea]|uniref:YfiR family protein n=1 Tax=Rhodocytophaga rosea TaxID=2704465 RepID=A0A6C0GN87_9BACT|nr:YfiR family protein [Rhodocytophaga rosea]QHT69496.1 YfiR family protein [Rhodocytophaga rosea]